MRTAQPNSSTGAGWITLSISQEEASIGAGLLPFTPKIAVGSWILGGIYWLGVRLNCWLKFFLGAGETVLERLEVLFPVIWLDVHLT